MTSDQITGIILAIVGTGILQIIVNHLINPKKATVENNRIEAESKSTLSEAEVNQETAQAKAFEALSHSAQTLLEIAEVRIKNLADRAEKVEKQLDEAEIRYQTLRDKADKLKQEIRDREVEIAKAQMENKSLESDIANLQRQISERDETIRKQNARIGDQDIEISNLKAEVAELSRQVTELRGNKCA